MSDISSLLGNAAAPLAVECGGRTFTARLVDQRMKSQWERWLRANALREATEMLGGAEAAAPVVVSMATARKFRWKGHLSNELMQTEEGGLAFAALVFGVPEADMAALFRDRKAETDIVLEQVIAEAFPEEYVAWKARQSGEQEGTPRPNPFTGPPPA